MADDNEGSKRSEEDLTRTERKQLEQMKEALKSTEDSIELHEKLEKIFRRQYEASSQMLEVEKERLTRAGDRLGALQAEKELEEENLRTTLRAAVARGEEFEEILKIQQALKDVKEEQANIAKIQQGATSLAGTLASKMGLAANAQQGFLRSVLDTETPMKAMSVGMSDLRMSLGDTFTTANIAVSAATKLMKAFATQTLGAIKEADQLRSEFVAITGDAGATRDAFINLTLANTDLAIGFKEMMGAQMSLREGFVDFVFLSSGVQESLTLQTATMEKLGVDASTTSEAINTLTQSFGMSHSSAIQMQRDMVGLGQALGIPPKTITQEFTKALPALAEFGDRATEVFERLVIASRETGLSVDALMGTFGDAMNTYEGSTKAAGRLNAVLGSGIISGTELLMADAEERFRIVQEGLELTGKSFQDLGRYERITIAQAAGFRNADEAARAFGNTQEDLATKIGDTAITQAEMDELARQATDSMTQLKYAMMSFAVAIQPAVEGFAALVDKFIEFSSGFPGGAAGMVSLLTTLAGIPVAILNPLAGGAMIAAGVSGGLLATAGAVDDGSLTFEAATGQLTRVPINSQDTAQVMLSKPSGPMERAAPTVAAAAPAATNTTLVVKVMLNERELGEAVVPMIDRRVLGSA